jgi:hypothetical protein
MAQWISEAQEAAAEEIEDEDAEETAEPMGPVHWPRKWQSMTLEKLFGTSPRKAAGTVNTFQKSMGVSVTGFCKSPH